MNSFGGDVAKLCAKTATGIDILSCTVSDPKSWCGFTTAAPSSVLASYSTYVSAVTSFWKAKSETISLLATSCPVAWGKPNLPQHEWLKIAIAHAECYMQAHPETGSRGSSASSTTRTSSVTTTSATNAPTTTTTTTSRGVTPRGKALEGYALMSTVLAALVNAVV